MTAFGKCLLEVFLFQGPQIYKDSTAPNLSHVFYVSQFDYEEFLYQQLERGEIFSSLEVLKIRNLKIPLPLTPQSEDYCK